jgi:hypothetical protein
MNDEALDRSCLQSVVWCGGRNRGLTPCVYRGTYVPIAVVTTDQKLQVERVQTGVRMEKRLLKVLKGLAEYHDLTLGDLLEGIVRYAFDGKCPFGRASLQRISDLKKFYHLDLNSTASHRLVEVRAGDARKRRKLRK